jgi:2-iminobutanoate/2-iminopropanoate deaminase
MSRRIVASEQAPPPLGPYSQAVQVDGLLFCTGQLPLDAAGELVAGSAEEQVEQCLRNLSSICATAGADLGRAARTTVYLSDLGDYGAVNEVYRRYFPEEPPARVTLEVSRLPAGAAVEIEAVVPVDKARAGS